MPHSNKEDRIRFWRHRAEELRTTASQFKDRILRKGLLDAAVVYDRLADHAEKPREVVRETPAAPARRPRRKIPRKHPRE